MRYFVEGAPEGGPTRIGVIMDDGTEIIREDVHGIALVAFAHLANAFASVTIRTPLSED